MAATESPIQYAMVFRRTILPTTNLDIIKKDGQRNFTIITTTITLRANVMVVAVL
jgi:hypothetical protein